MPSKGWSANLYSENLQTGSYRYVVFQHWNANWLSHPEYCTQCYRIYTLWEHQSFYLLDRE